MIITHRGRTPVGGENTIASFINAIQLGAQGIECDARITLDGKVVLHHNGSFTHNGINVSIARSTFSDLKNITNGEIVTLDVLFTFAKEKNVPLFIEVKSSSPVLIHEIAKYIKKHGLWNLVHVVGFSVFIATALRMQAQYPKLKVIQFINNPLYSFIRRPKKSYGVALGWIDEWKGSQRLFQTAIPSTRLEKLRLFYERHGFHVIAGVINNDKGIHYFTSAGITDLVTDQIALASLFVRS